MAPKQQTNAYVLGVGMTKFLKPRGERDYVEMGYEAGVKAMLDAKINYDEVETGVACYCYGPTTAGQRVFYQFGMSTIPIYNTNNACATGSVGLQIARQLVKNGAIDCALVVGFEQMKPGPLVGGGGDHPSPMEMTFGMMAEKRGFENTPPNAQLFANAGREYMEKFGAEARDFAEIGRISHEHSQRNPYAQFQQKYTLEQVEKSPMIHFPVTKLQCSPTSDGAGAAVIVSEAFLNARPHLRSQAILMAGQSMMTDSPHLYSKSDMGLVGYDMTARAAKAALKEANVNIKDVKVCELHDCFSANQLILIDGLGFSEPGKAHEMIRRGDITYGGNGVVINPSGGLISKGHPLGATGLAQCCELTWQLRGWANNRLVDTKVALQHNLGLGGAVVINVYKRADGKANTKLSDAEIAKVSGFGYNPAVEARGITREDSEKVRSTKMRSDVAMSDTLEKIDAWNDKTQKTQARL